eukprot:s824_g9.t1
MDEDGMHPGSRVHVRMEQGSGGLQQAASGPSWWPPACQSFVSTPSPQYFPTSGCSSSSSVAAPRPQSSTRQGRHELPRQIAGLALGLTALRAFGGRAPGAEAAFQMREAKRKREASQFFTYQARLLRTGVPPRDDLYWRREERMLFSTARMEKGINFAAYDEVEVERRGGLGQEAGSIEPGSHL